MQIINKYKLRVYVIAFERHRTIRCRLNTAITLGLSA